MVALILINFAGAAVSLLKGKIWSGIIGIFIPVISIITAIRLAVPGSPWARWRYPEGSAKLAAAIRRDQRLRRPFIRAKIWFQELIAGRHDLILEPSPAFHQQLPTVSERSTPPVRHVD